MKISDDALLSIDLALFQLDYIPECGAIELDSVAIERDGPFRWEARDTARGLWMFDGLAWGMDT